MVVRTRELAERQAMDLPAGWLLICVQGYGQRKRAGELVGDRMNRLVEKREGVPGRSVSRRGQADK